MYRLLPPEALDLFQKNYRQIVDIQFNGTANTRTLNESHIIQGGLSIDRYCVSGSRIEIGSAVASELTLKLDNRNDQFADEVFEGAELYVRIGIQKWDALKWENAKTYWIPCGYFTVDETPRKLSNITLAALDRMVRFDVPVDPARLSFPISVGNLLRACCEICNVPLETNAFSLTNAEYMVTALPEEDNLTYRQLIQWIAEISATCAYIDWNGKLRLEWYTNTDVVISPAERYTSDMYEQDVVITGVQVTDDDDNVYLAGTDDYAFNIENNLLIQHDHTAVVQAIFGKVGGFTYRPYNCTCKPMPWLYPLDAITYVDKNGVEHPTIVTRINFKMNASTLLEGKGETSTRNGYAAANPLTKAESVVMKKLETRVNKNIEGAKEAALNFNQVISNSLGLFRTEVVEIDDSVSYYYHDSENIENSTIIYTFRAGGFAWTDDWNDGDPVWNYGVTRDGNAILNYLTVNKLNADQIEANSITADKIALGEIGGFVVDREHIGYGEKETYNDNKEGVFISPNGIGFGKGTFYVDATGFLHAETGEFMGAIKGGTININDNFKVDADGNVTLNGNISWGTNASPTQVVYARTALTKPADGSEWSGFPSTNASGWHRSYDDYYDYFASYTYDGGKTWGNPMKIRGTDGLPGVNGTDGKDGNNGINGKDGVNGSDGDTIQIVYLYYRKSSSTPPSVPSYSGDTLPSNWKLAPQGVTSYYKYEFISQCTVTNGIYGSWTTPVIWAKYGSNGSDASVTAQNVFNALTNNGTMYGCFTGVDNKLYINAEYIQAGTVSSNITFTGKLVADDAQISGHISASSGHIGGWYIGVNDGYLRTATGTYGTYSWGDGAVRTATGYSFVALTPRGVRFVLKSGADYDNSMTIVETSSYLNSSGGTITPGGSILI